MYGAGRLSVLANQQVTPRNGVMKDVSPTGPALFPQWLIRILFLLSLLATAWQGFEIYDFPAKTWHLERLAGFIVSFAASAGIGSQGLRIQWPKGGTMVALLLCLGLSAPAFADERVLIEPDRQALMGEEAPRAADFVSWGVGVGVDYRAHRGAVPVVEAMGLVGLLRLGKAGPVLSLALGGSLLAAEGDPRAGAFLGGAFDLPGVGAPVKPALYVGAGYDGGWSFRGGFEFRFSQ